LCRVVSRWSCRWSCLCVSRASRLTSFWWFVAVDSSSSKRWSGACLFVPSTDSSKCGRLAGVALYKAKGARTSSSGTFPLPQHFLI
jgi:hypothetical protein